MKKETKKIEVEHEFTVGMIVIVMFIWMMFFSRGCDNEASHFDEYLRAAHGHVVEGVEYDPILKPESEKL